MSRGSSGTPATRLLDSRGVSYRLHAYAHDSGNRSFGAEAAERLGLPPEQVFKTLLVDTGGGLAVAIVPVAGALDLKAVATALGAKKVGMADPAVAERVTGMVVGGISPLGQKRALPTVLDASALEFPTVFVSAGRRGLDLELAPGDLVALTGALVTAVARS
ncbi:Cys-tRNA(Pro) deacylase [Granulicoccus sp. GXG6511]|uniref:Cys-tRNA(Pro) deacylase n=1 Tax=Granulicoccus sp. GXG6511 TaxID=3381351 RepID=UPI003D7D0B32